MKIVIQITSYWKYFFATFSTKPTPVVPAKNSAATKVPQHIPVATLIPVSISGSELGNITCLKICHLEAPSEWAACILDSCVPEAPALAEIIMIDKDTINNKKTFPKLSIPKTEITNGAHANGGTGLYNSISGSKKPFANRFRPIGIDIVLNKGIKKNIIFKKVDAINFLKGSNEVFDLILIKQTIHFFKKKDVKTLLNLARKHLSKKGKIIILSLKENSKLPVFKKMKIELDKSLKLDKQLIKIIKKYLNKYEEVNFKFKVNISKKDYLDMLKNKYISCLLNLTKKDIEEGQKEIKSKYKMNIQFYDILDCLIYKN